MAILKSTLLAVSACLFIVCSSLTLANDLGARIFSERCLLCHGNKGMGEGPLPMSLKNYPSANLLHNVNKQTREEVLAIILNGAGNDLIMPPWKDELNKNEVQATTDFIMQLRNDRSTALSVLKSYVSNKKQNFEDGKIIYETRCILCHGKTGLGDGRMSKIIKTPPPFNLTKSIMPPAYLRSIISNGGEAMGRSYQMPPWIDTLNENEIDAVIQYILTLRR